MERDEGAGEVSEDLRGGNEVGGEPLTEPELHKHEQAPHQQCAQEQRCAPFKELAS